MQKTQQTELENEIAKIDDFISQIDSIMNSNFLEISPFNAPLEPIIEKPNLSIENVKKPDSSEILNWSGQDLKKIESGTQLK
jgi:hypothetical protein